MAPDDTPIASLGGRSARTAKNLRTIPDRKLFEQWLENLDQSSQVILIVSPRIDSARVQRLPYLLRTCRFNGARGLVKSEAWLLEFKPTMVEDASYLPLKISYGIFVLDIKHEARQNTVPVIHQSLILQVVFADFRQVIGKWLPLGEQLLVAAKAAVQRVTPSIDNFRIWQNKM